MPTKTSGAVAPAGPVANCGCSCDPRCASAGLLHQCGFLSGRLPIQRSRPVVDRLILGRHVGDKKKAGGDHQRQPPEIRALHGYRQSSWLVAKPIQEYSISKSH